MKVDILVFSAHPDDAELSCSGTICKMVKSGKTVAMVDLTRGEMGTRGTAEIRAKESEAASKIMGISHRENLDLGDVFFEINEDAISKAASMIRKYRPSIVLANAINDRHPDHGKGAELVKKAFFVSGLRKVDLGGLAPWTAGNLFHYIQDKYLEPDFIIDISDEWDQKMNAIRAFTSQFYDPDSTEPATYISSPQFLESLMVRAKSFGYAIGRPYGEGFISHKKIGLSDLSDII